MSIPFTSSEHFLNETMALSRHTKPMKVSALRLAMAKHAGFSTVQAYVNHLDKPVIPASEATGLPLEECQTFIRRHEGILVFQAKTHMRQDDFDFVDEWNDQVEKQLLGPHAFGLQDITEDTIGGDTYVSGYIDLTEGDVVEQLPDIIEHFCTHNNDLGWGLPDLAELTLLELLNAFFAVSQGGPNALKDVFNQARILDRPLKASDFDGVVQDTRLAMNELVEFSEASRRLGLHGFGDNAVTKAIASAVELGLARSEAIQKSLTLLLTERVATMLATLVNIVLEDEPGIYQTEKDFVCGLQDLVMSEKGRRNRQAIKASFFTNQVYHIEDQQVVAN